MSTLEAYLEDVLTASIVNDPTNKSFCPEDVVKNHLGRRPGETGYNDVLARVYQYFNGLEQDREATEENFKFTTSSGAEITRKRYRLTNSFSSNNHSRITSP